MLHIALFGSRVGIVAAALVGAFVATTSPASAIGPNFTERRGGCSYTCEWRIVSGTCKTVFGVKVPCPLRKKACAKDFCTSTSH
jgi:hypothetical protein